MNLLVFIN